MIDETHDPALLSWIQAANHPRSDFPIQNLPYGVFRRRSSNDPARVGVAIGDQILGVDAANELKLLGAGGADAADAAQSCREPVLNGLMALGPRHWSALRLALSRLLRSDARGRAHPSEHAGALLLPMAEAEMLLPAQIGDYTDFYASLHHATNVGSMFRPDNPLLPNYKHVPIGYHGRASSIVPTGTAVRRPRGQTRAANAEAPEFGPSRMLDYEAEVGAFIGPGNALGVPVPIAEAGAQLFGLCLVNDWSARDIQAWEYQPLGPFLGKSFATTVSPWVVTADALAPFRTQAAPRAAGDPEPLPYLREASDAGAVALTLEAWLRTRRMRAEGAAAERLSQGNFSDMYWTLPQMIAHHASNGCNLRPGDLLGSGTVSGASKESRGCLLELTWRGAEPLELSNGEKRKFLEDGDEVALRAWCERSGARRIGFGECTGEIAGV